MGLLDLEALPLTYPDHLNQSADMLHGQNIERGGAATVHPPRPLHHRAEHAPIDMY